MLETFARTPIAEAAYIQHQVEGRAWTPDEIEELAREKADKYGVSRRIFVETMRIESGGFASTTIQSGYYENGIRETSYGVCQFYIPSNLKTADGEEITKDIAIDPVKCLDAAAYNFSVGNASQWSAYEKAAR